MEDLLAIARGQDAAMRRAAAAGPSLLILDTDPLMTAAWAEMLFGTIPVELVGYAKADLYLLFEADVDWIPDGTRFFGEAGQRERFARICESVLVRAGVAWERVSGPWQARDEQVRQAISKLAPDVRY
jgi:nicotinamide riboside kinase